MKRAAIAYIHCRQQFRPLLRKACAEAGFPLVVAIFPDDREMPGFPSMASLVVVESDSSPTAVEICEIADAAAVPVLIWAWGPAGFNPALADRRHHVHAPSEQSRQVFQALLRETLSHPEHFKGEPVRSQPNPTRGSRVQVSHNPPLGPGLL